MKNPNFKIEPIKWVSKKRKTYIRLGFVFIVIGITGLSIPFFSTGFISDTAFLNEVAKENAIPRLLPIADSSLTPTPTPSFNPDRLNIKNRLVIQKGGISLALIESLNANALFKGGWIWPNNPRPNKGGGNTVIFGHRFKYLPPLSNTLYNLDKVAVGDTFYIDWSGERYNYRISEVKVIEPTDMSVLSQTTDSQVTIITCFPLFSTKQRLVVIGKLVVN